MKSLHFCTPKKLQEIKTNSVFDTVRTGWIPTIYPGDIVKINERVTINKKNTDSLICQARCIAVEPLQYNDFIEDPTPWEEVDRYNRKFHGQHWFFKIRFKKLKTLA